jgi:hypothetical protein
LAGLLPPPAGTVAIRLPRGYGKALAKVPGKRPAQIVEGAAGSALAIKQEFEKLLPDWKVFYCTGHAATGTVIVRPISDYASPFHWTLPDGTPHPFQGQEKFLWVDRGDGVLYGVPNPDTAHPDDVHMPPDIVQDTYGFTVQKTPEAKPAS